MVYFGKKQSGDTSHLQEQIDQIEQELNGVAKLGLENTFTAKNTFQGETTFGRIVNAGTSDGQAYLLPVKDSGFTDLKIGNSPRDDNKRFKINLESRSRITNCPDPQTPLEVANKQYVDSKSIYTIDKNQFRFTRQIIEEGKVVKYYLTNEQAYSVLDRNCNGIVSIACSDIPSPGQNLVITYFPKRSGNKFLIEIYQYHSSTDITSALQSANFTFWFTKSA